VLIRILTLVFAVLLFAAPQTSASADADIQSEAQNLIDSDELVIQFGVDVPAPRSARAMHPRTDEPARSAPALSRVFRPPRPLFD
jgi:hypothetical protein